MYCRPDDLKALFQLDRWWTLDVATESFAHGGKNFFGEGMLVTRTKTRIECSGKHFGRHTFFERGSNRPTAFPGVLHEAGVGVEFVITRQSDRSQIKQPRGDHAPAPPDLRDVGEVKIKRKAD